MRWRALIISHMRCFLAIELPDDVRRALGALQDRLRDAGAGVKWTRPEQIHLTVKFLGDVADRNVPEVTEAARALASRYPSFDLEVRSAGCFPPKGPARIVWAGLADPPAALIDLHRDAEQSFAELGFKPENRAFKPHLTIGRVKESRDTWSLRDAVASEAGFTADIFPVDELVLFQSILDLQGPTYVPIAHLPFSKT